MTWIPEQRRWTKRYRGRRYYVSARQLGCKETKEDSIQAANQWWRDKQADLDIAARPVPRTPRPMEDIAAALIGGEAWTDLAAVARAAVSHLNTIQPSLEAEALAERIEDAAYQQDETGDAGAWEHIATALGNLLLPALIEKAVLAGEPLPPQLAERLSPARRHQVESAIKGLRGEAAAPPDRTVQAQMEAWLRTQRAQVAIGSMKPERYENVRIAAGHFAAFIGESADAATIDAPQLEGYYRYCLSKIADQIQDSNTGWSVSYTKEVFSAARRFVRWLWEQRVIDLPRNLDSRGFKFGSSAKQIEIWTTDEARRAVCTASGKMRLALLLMLNIGATQQDISDLLDSEVNWRAGRIIRKRSKTRGRASVPTVNYKLWDSTFALLKEHRSGQERVLLNKSGRPYVRAELVNGKLVRADDFNSLYGRLKEKLCFKRPLKALRKTAASLLESHPVYGRFTTLFLGHSPASMKDRHYAAPPQDLFDEAVRWLGEQLGVAELPADE
jgi:hypothetical protein